ncbi:MAG: pyruvate dehydrogenase (acetyl-transferring) E1 component subunit alpha [Chlamydiia bacterium]|nr:pyruvate dehydrogenase (acetyl-transferring) E1 component subunit alpha [Chlamydiia bacterium]
MGKKTGHHIKYHFFKADFDQVAKELGKDKLKTILKEMLLIRHFELRAESAYQHGKVGGFFHAYMGQEAIQTAAVNAMGREGNWWTTTYRCHALSMLMGATPNEMMAELYGKVTGNAMGRGGSMHLYADRMLGGFGIVGGHLPIATGAAFSLKYQKEEGVSVCFLGDGAFVQGAVHESLNLASLWDLPCIYVIENNQWGMGTAVNRALCNQPIAENFGPAYGIKSYSLDGMDFVSCYEAFKEIYNEVKKTKRPVLVEAVTERFRGHSISDPALYRTKEELEEAKGRDPIHLFSEELKKRKLITDKEIEDLDKEQKEVIIASMKFAEESSNPDPITLEEDVFAP